MTDYDTLAAELRAAASEWMCPAPESRGPCLARLPCAEHGVTDHVLGSMLWGNSYFLAEVPRNCSTSAAAEGTDR